MAFVAPAILVPEVTGTLDLDAARDAIAESPVAGT